MIFTQGQIQDMLSILKKKEGFIKQTKFETKSLKEEIQKVESDFQNQLTKLLGEKFPISKVSIGSENATITLKGSTYGVEVYFYENYKGEREYEVQTTSYGPLTLDSPKVNNILLQAELLTNKSLIELTKNVMIKVSDLKENAKLK